MVIIPDDNELIYEVLNARVIHISSTNLINPLMDKNNDIIALEVGEYFIQTGDEFDTKICTLKDKYIIKYIEKIDSNNYSLITHKRNRTTSYILPCLDGNKVNFYVDNYLINAYIAENLRYLNLIYRFNTHKSYKLMEYELIKHKSYFNFSDEKNSFVVFRFKIPDRFISDIELFLAGKYSKFSDELKKRIQIFNKFDKKQKIVQTIFKDNELKSRWEEYLNLRLSEDSELDSLPEISNEIFNLNLIK